MLLARVHAYAGHQLISLASYVLSWRPGGSACRSPSNFVSDYFNRASHVDTP